MLYKIAHLLRDKLGWLWNIIEWINGVIFYMRFDKRLRNFNLTTVPKGYTIQELRDVSVAALLNFFAHQPEEAYTYFRPHGFDEKSIKRLQRNSAFLDMF